MKKAKADAVVVSTTVMHLKAPWKTLGKSGCFYPQLIKEMLGISGKNGVKQKWKADAIRILFHSSDPNDILFGNNFVVSIEEDGMAIYAQYPIAPDDILKNAYEFFCVETIAAMEKAQNDNDEEEDEEYKKFCELKKKFEGVVDDDNGNEDEDEDDDELPDNTDTERKLNMEWTKKLEGLKGRHGIIRLVADDPNIRFTNTLFNPGESDGNLTVNSLSKEFNIQNPRTKEIFGVHKNAWGYFTVAIAGTETELHSTKKEKKSKSDKKARKFCRREN